MNRPWFRMTRFALIAAAGAMASPGSPEPVATPWLAENFAGYQAFADIQKASWYQASDYTHESLISVDLNDGPPGGSGRSLRYDFPPGAGGVGIDFKLPSPTADLWTEIWAKFSPDFNSGGMCGGNNPDYKFVFWYLEPGEGRNEIKVGNYGNMRNLDTRYFAGPDELRIQTPAPINSGQWHRYRIHNRIMQPRSNVFSVEFWDGRGVPRRLTQTYFALGSANGLRGTQFREIDRIALGANRNCAAGVGQWMKYGSITLYQDDPGWGF